MQHESLKLFDVNDERFFRAVERMGLHDDIVKHLHQADRETTYSLRVRIKGSKIPEENGRVKVVLANRVRHNRILGPYQGGLRFHPQVSVDGSRALAAAATWRAALHGVPFGGAAGGVRCDPKLYSEEDLRAITEAFVVTVHADFAPMQDTLSPDVYTDAQVMDWICHFFARHERNRWADNLAGVVTGKSPACGGLEGHATATGLGVVEAVKGYHRHQSGSLSRERPLEGLRCLVQGYGSVGREVARRMVAEGARLVAVQDLGGAIVVEEGLDPDALADHVREAGSVAGFRGGREVSAEAFFAMETDVFIPSALEGEVHEGTAPIIRAKLVAEAGNYATTPKGDRILADRGIDVLPDIYANAGGVIVSWCEWDHNVKGTPYAPEDTDRRVREAMAGGFRRLVEVRERYRCDFRTAAMVLALATLRERLLRTEAIFGDARR